MAFHVAFIVVGTLVINGCLAGPIIRYLGLDRLPQTRILQISEAFNTIMLTQGTQMEILKQDRFLAHCNWGVVRKLCFSKLKDPSVKMVPLADSDARQEALTAYYRAFRASVAHNFKEGILTPWVHWELIKIAEEAAENNSFLDAACINKSLRLPLVLRWLWKLKPLHPLLSSAMFHHAYRGTLMAFGFFYGLEDIARHPDQFLVGLGHKEVCPTPTLSPGLPNPHPIPRPAQSTPYPQACPTPTLSPGLPDPHPIPRPSRSQAPSRRRPSPPGSGC